MTRNHLLYGSIEAAFWGNVALPVDYADCWIWTGYKSTSKGKPPYGRLSWHGKKLRAGEVALSLIGVEVPTGAFICHRCDTPPCVNPAHLFVGTHADNMRDMALKGRSHFSRPEFQRRGSMVSHCKLTEGDITKIRNEYIDGKSPKHLAHRYTVSTSLIEAIVTSKVWKHVPAIPPDLLEARRTRVKNKIINVVPCACGCGRTITVPDQYGRHREFIQGHSWVRNITAKLADGRVHRVAI